METTVYIVGIVAVAVVIAIIGVTWFMRDRLTGGRVRLSAKEREGEAEFKAASPKKEGGRRVPKQPASVDISGNWLIGTNTIRVLRDKARVSFNSLLGRNRVEVGSEPPPTVTNPKKRGQKK